MFPIGEAWGQFFVRYYVVALVFVVFGVEAIFLIRGLRGTRGSARLP